MNQVSLESGELRAAFFQVLDDLSTDRGTNELDSEELDQLRLSLEEKNTRIAQIQNRRYLGNKYSLTDFIRESIEESCGTVDSVIDIFAGTGAVSYAFRDKRIVVNDLLYSNFIVNQCWFLPHPYRPKLVVSAITFLNSIESSRNNYMRANFSNTYFAADDCSKIGEARQLVEDAWISGRISRKEYAILVTSIIFGMDRVANTVGHYDAYRKGVIYHKSLDFPVILPESNLSKENKVLNSDANSVIGTIEGDLLYCDPPYNSRQYSDAYHLLENVAKWEKPEVYGVARKMDRSTIKSAYNTVRASEALRDLIKKANVKYIAISYNNMAQRGNGRSNAKISDAEILEILEARGEVRVFQTRHKAFSSGKSNFPENAERLFICKVKSRRSPRRLLVRSPLNYTGGKFKLLPQLLPLLPESKVFVDVFSGGCNVGMNAKSSTVIFNDKDIHLVNLLEYLSKTNPQTVIREVEKLIAKYGLSDTLKRTYKEYGVNSSRGLADINRVPYLKLREDYNTNRVQLGEESNAYLYALIIFGFNNQIRFNKKGEFNLPVGKRDFNLRMRDKLVAFHTRMQELDYCFSSRSFAELDLDKFHEVEALFYCDPPYLITQATYNENGGWTEIEERSLLDFLDRVAAAGQKFALSNVLESKGRKNLILEQWLFQRDYYVHELEHSYSNSNYQRADRCQPTREVLITNY